MWAGYLSTTGVYGDRGGARVDETDPPRPTSARGERRVAAESAWLALHRTHGVPVHVFRLAGIYGPGRSALDQMRAGTARRIDPETHRYSSTDYTASFIGFLPVSAPRWTILVVLNAPKRSYYGAQTAAPIFHELAERLLALDAVPPDAPEGAELAAARR